MPKRDWTVLLIGGASAKGKTSLATALGRHFGCDVVHTDRLWLSLRNTLPPEHEFHVLMSEAVWRKGAEEVTRQIISTAHYVSDAIEPTITAYAFEGIPAIYEGASLLPPVAAQKYGGLTSEMRALYLFEPSIEDLTQRIYSRDQWLERESPENRRIYMDVQYQHGVEIKRQAQALNLPVLESRPFETLFERALAALRPRAS